MARSQTADLQGTASKLVSLHDFRTREAPPPPRGNREDAGYAPLAEMMDSVASQLSADALLVTWHQTGEEPRFLFANGSCEAESQIERSMILAATSAVAVADTKSQSRWMRGCEDDAAAVLVTHMPAPQGVMTITSMFRKLSDPARQRIRESSVRLLPLLQAFFGMWRLRASAVSRASSFSAALDANSIATLLFDGDGNLLFANDSAEQLIACNNGLRRSGKTMSGTRLADTLRLQAAIEHVAHDDPTAPSNASSPVVALHRKDGRPLLAAVMRAAGHGGAAGAIVRVFDPDQSVDMPLGPVCKLYGLSPVEARLACLLAKGEALCDAARQMRVREQTARSYLKQVFLKTDTNRQAELVSLMLKSAVRMTPGCRTNLV